MEATTRFGLVNRGFADLCLTSWLCRHIIYAPNNMYWGVNLERVTRLELATSTLARSRSAR